MNQRSNLKKSVNSLTVLGMCMALFTLTFAYLALVQHWGLKTQLDDLGNMSQPLWNTLHGRFMEMSNTPGLPFERMHRFAGHTNFIFLLLVPIYALWSDPQVLLLIQVVLATSAAVPLYLLGKKLLGEKSWLALVGPIVYLVNPMLHDAVLYDMHAVVLALPFLLCSIYFLEVKNYRLFCLSALLLVSAKEDMPLILLMLGLWHGWRSKDWRRGGAIAAVGAVIFGVLMAVVMPMFRQEMPEHLIARRYQEVGGSVSGIALKAITQPHVILNNMLQNGLVNYVLLIFTGFGFLPSLSLLSLAILPTISINLLSNNPITSQPFGYYYLAPVVGILSAATIYSLESWKNRPLLVLTQKQVAVGVVVVAVVFSWWTSPAPYSRVSNWKEFKVDSRWAQFNQIKAMIPQESSLSVQNNLGPHLVNRADIVRFPFRADTSDYVLVDITDPYPVLRGKPRQRNIVHVTQLFPQEYYDAVIRQLENPDYGVTYFSEGFILFERGYPRELNRDAYMMFRERAERFFAPYQPVAPVEYYEPGFVEG